MQLEPTGERMIEASYLESRSAYAIYVLHVASYEFARSMCRNQRVLDLGCGTGYGAAKLASAASSVVGVDVSPDAIAFAKEAYAPSGVDFRVIDPNEALPFADGSFDVVLSFQVIEHVVDDRNYIAEANRVLSKGGVFVVITPDRASRLLPFQKPWNRWHLREYSMAQLRRLVETSFRVESALRMGAPDEIASIELNRYRWTKWLTLPFTFPGIPELCRRLGLDFLHAFRPRRRPADARAVTQKPDFGFDEGAIIFSSDAPNSLNLVIVARAD